MNVFERGGVCLLASRFNIRHLASHHARSRSNGVSDFVDHAQLSGIFGTASGPRLEGGHYFKRERQKRVTGQDGHCFPKDAMASGLAAPEVVIIERRKIIVNQRVSMN